MKYVVIEHQLIEVPIIFPEVIDHHEIAKNHVVVSAGHCRIASSGKVVCWGRSVGLKINSRIEDARLIERELNRDD